MPEQPSWTWPTGRVLILYHWSWFDPDIGDIVVGWSQQGEADDANYVHLEAEGTRGEAETRQIPAESRDFVVVKAHTFSPLSRLPGELRDADGTPLPWVRALLGAD